MNTDDLLAIGDRTGNPSYSPARMILTRGDGMYVFDDQGQRYLDFLAGIAVNCLGNCAPEVVAAVQRQAETLLHVSNIFYSDVQIRLQKQLIDACFGDRVFLCNSGAEANEAAIKLARRYQRVVRGEDRTEIITFHNSFHGRTLAAITATGQPKYHEGFEPMVPGFVYAEFGDIESVERLAGHQTVAIMVEPVQGEGGVRPAPPGFLPDLRRLCEDVGALLVFDEVQTGVGRTGHLFAYEHFDVAPDIMTLAKALGGGVPIGAMVATDEVFQGFTRGSHASTFGGNPLACAAAEAVLTKLQSPGFLDEVKATGRYLRQRLSALDTPIPVKAVRGCGLMVGAEVGAETAGLVAIAARQLGLLINTAGGTTLRFVPPLIATKEHVDAAMDILAAAMAQVAEATT
jgi:predicted acetylornithine/succinylornithine family transaminase